LESSVFIGTHLAGAIQERLKRRTVFVAFRSLVLIISLLLLPGSSGSQTVPTGSDIWQPLKFLVGRWEGTGDGQPGASKIEREYRFVLNNKFLHVQNRSVYDPQPKNPKGETHEDWSMISFDKVRKQFVLRQFHVEGFVNQYVSTSTSPDGKTIIFTSEGIENIPTGWRARETYKVVNADEFMEVFELAEPGKDFQIYSEGHFRRRR
jgi:hypothetical protein